MIYSRHSVVEWRAPWNATSPPVPSTAPLFPMWRIFGRRQAIVWRQLFIPAVEGSLAVTEAPDTIGATAARWRTGQVTAGERADVAALAGTAIRTAAIAVTEAPDAGAILGEGNAAITSSSVAAIEARDSAAVTGRVTTGTTVAITEARDAVAVAGNSPPQGAIAATEARDTTALATSGTTIPQPSRPIVGAFATFGKGPLPKLELPPLQVAVGCSEAADMCAVYAVNDRAGPLNPIDDLVARAEYEALRRRIERDDLELLLEL